MLYNIFYITVKNVTYAIQGKDFYVFIFTETIQK